MINRVIRYIREYHMIDEGDCVVAGVSGGDSASGKSAKETGSASGPRSLPLRFFFSSFSMPRSARRAPLQAVSSIRSPP